MRKKDSTVKEEILNAALEIFANKGFDGTSISDIVNATSVTKPMVYYYFNNKSGLYQALVDLAFDKTYHAMRQAARKKETWEKRVVGVVKSVFDFTIHNTDLTRIAFAAAFAAPQSIPEDLTHLEKGNRNFEIVLTLIGEGIETKKLRSLDSYQLAAALYGLMTFQVMSYLVEPLTPLTLESAHQLVDLYLKGASNS